MRQSGRSAQVNTRSRSASTANMKRESTNDSAWSVAIIMGIDFIGKNNSTALSASGQQSDSTAHVAKQDLALLKF